MQTARIKSFEGGNMDNFVHFADDIARKHAVVFNPARDVSEIIHVVKAQDLTLTDIL